MLHFYCAIVQYVLLFKFNAIKVWADWLQNKTRLKVYLKDIENLFPYTQYNILAKSKFKGKWRRTVSSRFDSESTILFPPLVL